MLDWLGLHSNSTNHISVGVTLFRNFNDPLGEAKPIHCNYNISHKCPEIECVPKQGILKENTWLLYLFSFAAPAPGTAPIIHMIKLINNHCSHKYVFIEKQKNIICKSIKDHRKEKHTRFFCFNV